MKATTLAYCPVCQVATQHKVLEDRPAPNNIKKKSLYRVQCDICDEIHTETTLAALRSVGPSKAPKKPGQV